MTALIENPSSIRVRKLEPWVVITHTRMAENEGVSLEEHLRVLLKDQALKAQEDFADELDKLRVEIAEQCGTNFPDSAELIRAVREEAET